MIMLHAPALRRLGWLPVQDMLNFRDAINTFKCIKGLAPSYLSEKFELRSEVHNVNTRHKKRLKYSTLYVNIWSTNFSL